MNSHREKREIRPPTPPYPYSEFEYRCGVTREGFAHWFWWWIDDERAYRRHNTLRSAGTHHNWHTEAMTKHAFCSDCALSFRKNAESEGTCIREEIDTKWRQSLTRNPGKSST